MGILSLRAKEEQNPLKSLRETSWTSQFNYYSNYYYFDSDSTGFSQDGQVAWSCPITPSLVNEKNKDSIIYTDKERFIYHIKDSTLFIKYPDWKINDTIVKRAFRYNSTEKAWGSIYKYSYGREWLTLGTKKSVLKLDF